MADEQAAPPAPAGESEDDIINDLVQQHAQQELEKRAEDKPKAPSKEPKPSRPGERDEQHGDVDDVAGDEAPEVEPEANETAEGSDEHVEDLTPEQALAECKRLAGGSKEDIEKAFLLAFGKRPEAFQVNPEKLAAFRRHEQRERQKTRAGEQKLLTDRQTFDRQVSEAIERLRPYDQLYRAAQSYRQTGDSKLIRELVTGLTGKPYDEAQRDMLRDAKRSPSEQRLEAQIQELRAQLAARDEQERKQATERTAAQQREADLAVIGKELKAHAVAKVPRWQERVYRVLEKHYDPRRGLQITLEDAADRIVAAERRRVEASPFYKRPAPKAEPAEPPRPAKRPPLRRESTGGGVAVGDETEDDIIRDLTGQIARQKLAQAAGGKRR